MFILGLIVGPAIGLLVGDFVFHSKGFGTAWAALVIGLLLIALLLAPVFQLGLRAGLTLGVLLGLLLIATPMSPSARTVDGGASRVAGD